MATNLCYEGWALKDGNSSGRCCCNCKYQRPVVKHPWNKQTWAKGSITESIGWGCTVPEMPSVVLLEIEHSMCELHEWKALE